MPSGTHPVSDIWKITEEKIVAMLSDSPRRLRLCDISAKFKERPSPLRRRGDSHTLRFPFYNTYIPALSNWRRYLKDRGWRMWNQEEFFENNRHHIDLKNASPEDLQLIQVWLTMISTKLCIKDCLACTIALDYTNMEGDPAKAPTEVSILRTRAKLYGPQDEPGDDTIEAANDLAKLCIDLIATSHAFYGIDSVVAVPRSDPRKKYSLPAHIAGMVAHNFGIDDLTFAVAPLQKRRETKDTPVKDRLANLKGTMAVDPAAVSGRRILLIDDLYHTGVTLNYVAMLLQEAGATTIYGLCCEKTCRNKD